MRRLIIGITGASCSIYAVRMLKMLQSVDGIETHLVVSSSGMLNIHHEMDMTSQQVQDLADHVYNARDIGATLASGAFRTDGMVIVPCSMKTLAAVAHGLADNLITRAADVTLKERRRLALVVREAPFNLAHLRNMTAVTEMGGVVYPPMPALYHRPASIEEMVDHTVSRVLGLMDVDVPIKSWEGLAQEGRKD